MSRAVARAADPPPPAAASAATDGTDETTWSTTPYSFASSAVRMKSRSVSALIVSTG